MLIELTCKIQLERVSYDSIGAFEQYFFYPVPDDN